MENEKIKKMEAQIKNLYLDNRLLKETIGLILDRLEFIEENSVFPEDMFDEEVQVFPVEDMNMNVTQFHMTEVT